MPTRGGYIAEGYDAALDDLRDAGAGGRRAIAALEADIAGAPASRRSRSGTTACSAITSRCPRAAPMR